MTAARRKKNTHDEQTEADVKQAAATGGTDGEAAATGAAEDDGAVTGAAVDDLEGGESGSGEAAEAAAPAGDEAEDREPDPLEILTRERDEFQEKWLRTVAEMDNLRKRTRRELTESRRLAQADVLRPILGVLDNFERALQSLHENKEHADLEKFLEGVDLIFQNFQGVMRDLGVTSMDPMGEEFDPVYHEAVGQMAREGVESGRVIEIVQNGFMFGDLVLRPARVIISA